VDAVDVTDPERFLKRESSAWEAFDRQVQRVPPESRERPGALAGWSVKDLVWHCAYWARFAADQVAETGAGPFVDPFDAHPDGYWDSVNAEVARKSAAMSWQEVRAGAGDARARLRGLLGSGAELAPEALTWAVEETFGHYDEHAEHIRAFADGPH
jgi:hypothetical protein